MDLKPVNLYVKHMGESNICHFGLDKAFHEIFSTNEIEAKYYYPIFYKILGADSTPAIPKLIISDIKMVFV